MFEAPCFLPSLGSVLGGAPDVVEWSLSGHLLFGITETGSSLSTVEFQIRCGSSLAFFPI